MNTKITKGTSQMFKKFTKQSWPKIGTPIIIKSKSSYNGIQIYSYMPYMYWQERSYGWSQYTDDTGQFFFANMEFDTEDTIIQAQDVIGVDEYEWCYYDLFTETMNKLSINWVKFDINDPKTYPFVEQKELYSKSYWVTYRCYQDKKLKVAEACFSHRFRWSANYDSWNFDPYDQILYYTLYYSNCPEPYGEKRG